MFKRAVQSALYRSGVTDLLRKTWRKDIRDEAAAVREALRDELRVDLDTLRTTNQEAFSRLKSMRTMVEGLRAEEEARASELDALRRTVGKLTLALELNDDQRELVATLESRLDISRITAHVRAAIGDAQILLDPFPHVIVQNVFPDDLYELLLAAIPPPVFFPERDSVKQNYKPGRDVAPTLTKRAWRFVDEQLAGCMLVPALNEKFAEYLKDHYTDVLGPALSDEAGSLPHVHSGGRLMLRRPGYRLAPHLDPKRVFYTALIYLARPGDSPAYGTQIFRMDRPVEATRSNTYYPERDGITCTLVTCVPFLANSVFAFVNGGGAHGAEIPKDAPASVERYAYQFYVGPTAEALSRLIERLPPDRQKLWERGAE
jgi:hypothetical protein